MSISILLLLAAFALFVVAIFWNAARHHLIAAGLACWVGSALFSAGLVR